MSEEKRFVMFRGFRMIEGWPEKIAEAQEITTYVDADDRDHPRIRYGDERDDWNADEAPCHDCAVIKGEYHVPGCDVEECPLCGGQLITCECWGDEDEEEGE